MLRVRPFYHQWWGDRQFRFVRYSNSRRSVWVTEAGCSHELCLPVELLEQKVTQWIPLT